MKIIVVVRDGMVVDVFGTEDAECLVVDHDHNNEDTCTIPRMKVSGKTEEVWISDHGVSAEAVWVEQVYAAVVKWEEM